MPDCAIRAHDPELVRLRVDDRSGRENAGAIVRMNHSEHIRRRRLERLAGDPEDPIAFVGPHRLVGAEVARAASKMRDPLSAIKLFFALGKSVGGMRQFRGLTFQPARADCKRPEK